MGEARFKLNSEKIGDTHHDFFSDRFARVEKRQLFWHEARAHESGSWRKTKFCDTLYFGIRRTAADRFERIHDVGSCYRIGKVRIHHKEYN